METTISPIFYGVKAWILTEAPTTIIRVENLMAKKDAEYPEDPARNVCNGAQTQLRPRSGTLQLYG
jgi:hypothetical protein